MSILAFFFIAAAISILITDIFEWINNRSVSRWSKRSLDERLKN